MELKNRLYQVVDEKMPIFQEVRDYIYDHPELGNREFISSQYLVEKMRALGFEVTYPYGGLETAFRAEFKNGDGPKVCFMAEYDALPGYGENGEENAHACGHNWIAASTLGAAVSLAEMKDVFSGTVVLIGTPAEETTGGKCDLVNHGCFDDIDAAMQMHLGSDNAIDIISLAMDSVEFNFFGKAAHAAGAPDQGINALDAVQLTFAGINALRQHIKSDARVHGIVTKGGTAVNTVPDRASCQFYIRAKTRAYVEELTEKIINCAKGACLMTGATLEHHFFENSYDDLVYHANLKKMLRANLEDLGITKFRPASLEASGSTDVGNVSHRCPTAYCEIDVEADEPAFAHDIKFLNYVHGSKADKTLNIATKAMAYTALQIFLNPEVLK